VCYILRLRFPYLLGCPSGAAPPLSLQLRYELALLEAREAQEKTSKSVNAGIFFPLKSSKRLILANFASFVID